MIRQFARWILHQIADDDLLGDILEQSHRGTGWLWRQALGVLFASLRRWPRQHQPELWYAGAGLGLSYAFGFAGKLHSYFLSHTPWWSLDWPWSQFVSDVAPQLLSHLVALPALAVGLRLRRAFRWQVMASAAAFSCGLLTAQYYSFAITPAGQPVRIFATLLLAAVLANRPLKTRSAS